VSESHRSYGDAYQAPFAAAQILVVFAWTRSRCPWTKTRGDHRQAAAQLARRPQARHPPLPITIVFDQHGAAAPPRACRPARSRMTIGYLWAAAPHFNESAPDRSAVGRRSCDVRERFA